AVLVCPGHAHQVVPRPGIAMNGTGVAIGGVDVGVGADFYRGATVAEIPGFVPGGSVEGVYLKRDRGSGLQVEGRVIGGVAHWGASVRMQLVEDLDDGEIVFGLTWSVRDLEYFAVGAGERIQAPDGWA